jgi:hypothetical protein
MSYFDEIDAWLSATLFPEEEEDEEQWFVRVKKQIKDKILESYRNGQRAGRKPEATADDGREKKSPTKRFPFTRKPQRQ